MIETQQWEGITNIYPVGRLPQVAFDIEGLKQEIADETYPARRNEMIALLNRGKPMMELGGDFITLPITRWKHEYKKGWLCEEGLFVGGIEERVPLWLSSREELLAAKKDPRNVEAKITKSLYTGPLPKWVDAKYSLAKELVPKEDLLVVSRHKAFFALDKTVEIVRKKSPLLVAYRENDTFVLLAAWGLEYELE